MDEQILMNDYLIFSDNILAQKLERSPRAIIMKRYQLGLFRAKKRESRRWTDEEKKFVFDNYKTMNYGEIATKLGRTKTAMAKYAKVLGLVGNKPTLMPLIECETCGCTLRSSGPSQRFCNECGIVHRREFLRNWQRKYKLSTLVDGKLVVAKVTKRDYPSDEICELCPRTNTRLFYHHWDDKNPSKGIWVCGKCHWICEAIDNPDYENFKTKYLQLKGEINSDWRDRN